MRKVEDKPGKVEPEKILADCRKKVEPLLRKVE